MPKVSILIPVFNRKRFIVESVQSALSQVFTDFEVVVVDNASDDGTWEICQQFAAVDLRVRVFRNESNLGPVRNWMRCVEEARGEFSKILFSDDCLAANCLSEMVPVLEDPAIAFVYSAARVGMTIEEAAVSYASTASPWLSASQYLNLVLIGEAPVSPGAILFRTSDLVANLHTQFPTSTVRPFEWHGAGPDLMISLLTARNYSLVANIPVPLVYFRAHNESFTAANSNNQVIDGYTSVVSYYLITNESRALWLDYLSYNWLQQMSQGRRWINPRAHLVEFEGTGSACELLTMFSNVLIHLVDKALGRKHCYVK